MKPKIPLKTQLKGLEKEELIQIISELSKINPKNKEFLEVFLKSSDEINLEGMINVAKQKMYKFIWGVPTTGKNSLKLREAKKVISDTSKILKEFPKHIADLKLYYVEQCNQFTQDFGDISGPFYDSVLTAYEDFNNYIRKHPELYNDLRERLLNLYKNSRDVGWGYSDEMEFNYIDLEQEFEEQLTENDRLVIENIKAGRLG